MLAFDPTDARLERAAKKEAIQISLAYYKEQENIEYEEVAENEFIAIVSLVPAYVTRFSFMESQFAQMRSDFGKEDGVNMKFKIQY